MADADDIIELLFFDTFSHEIHEVSNRKPCGNHKIFQIS